MSSNILSGRGGVKWLTREASLNPPDNGWRVLSDVDTDELLSDPANLSISDLNALAAIEPAVISVYTLPVGSDIQPVIQPGRRRWHDNTTGQETPLP